MLMEYLVTQHFVFVGNNYAEDTHMVVLGVS